MKTMKLKTVIIICVAIGFCSPGYCKTHIKFSDQDKSSASPTMQATVVKLSADMMRTAQEQFNAGP